MWKHILLGMCLLGILGILGRTLWWTPPARQVDTFTTTEPIRIAMAVTPLSAPFMVAHERGYFAQHGLVQVTLTPYVGGHRALKAMLEGEADIATASDLPTMFHSFVRDDYAVLFTFVTSDYDVKVITRRDTGVHVAADFADKTIGATFGTSSHFFLNSFLVYHQVNPDRVHITHVSPEDMTLSLQNGTVDAVATWEPFAYKTVKALGQNAIVISHPEGIYKETFNALAQKQFISSHQEVIHRLTQAITVAIDFMRNNEAESQKIVRGFLADQTEFLAAIWKDFVFDIGLHQSLIVTLENEARWAINNGLVGGTQIPNYLRYLYLDGLKAVRPEAISIIQ
jgi:NitT/TauT family transport system substrate-binding protein